MSDSRHGSEFDLIDRHFKPLAEGEAGALGLTDDAAVLDVPDGQQIVVSTDALVAGVHFLADMDGHDVATKVAGANLSDLAAMGAAPKWALLALQINAATSDDWIAGFAAGLGRMLKDAGATLVGGDTVSTPGPVAATLTVIGWTPRGCALTRSGAQDGDDLYVTGTIGDGALGLLCWTGKLTPNDHLFGRYARPQPRNTFARHLAQDGLATACADISDGLAADVGHIAQSSGVDIVIDTPLVPLSTPARAALQVDPRLMRVVLAGGDDYELAFTARPANAGAIQALAGRENLQVTQIGRVVGQGGQVRVVDAVGQPLDLGPGGYVHR